MEKFRLTKGDVMYSYRVYVIAPSYVRPITIQDGGSHKATCTFIMKPIKMNKMHKCGVAKCEYIIWWHQVKETCLMKCPTLRTARQRL